MLLQGGTEMANITIRIDEGIKKQLQKLMTELGLDITTYFTMAAKQAIREQGIPFKITTNTTGGNENEIDLERLQ